MLPPLDEWDLEQVKEIADPAFGESGELEKKASAKFDLTTKPAKAETKSEIAKQICAFANAGGGFIVFGVNDIAGGGGVDGGIEDKVGSQPVREWVEALVPK